MTKELWLNKEIYSKDLIRKTMIEYEDYAKLSVIDYEDYICVLFIDCKYNEDRTVKEFENYLIGLENI